MLSQMHLITVRVPKAIVAQLEETVERRRVAENSGSLTFHRQVTSSAVLRDAIEKGLISIAAELGPPKRKAKRPAKKSPAKARRR